MEMGHSYPQLFFSATRLLILTIFASLQAATCAAHPTELLFGFKASPDPAVTTFQPLLFDLSGNYSLGFLRVDAKQLSLSVVHVPSSVQLWSANPTRPAGWARSTMVLFNGSLVLSDPRSGVFWSTHTSGYRVCLSGASNLIVQKADAAPGNSPLWQSFDFPSDTLVENQNFTSSMALISSNGIYSMRLGSDYWGLYAKFGSSDPGQMYVRHGAMETRAEVDPGRPTQLILNSGGFLGMYQNGSSSSPVDVQPFNTFGRNGSGIHRVRLEPDGNLKGYFWVGSGWISDYQAISEHCELPSACGAYGLCRPGGECSYVSSRTVDSSGDFCGSDESRFRTMRRTGVELPFKELMRYKNMASLEECEGACEVNCTCWGAVYSNSSGFCYMLDFPVQTLVEIRDETKVGYFKVREGAGKSGVDARLVGAVLVLIGMLGLGLCMLRSRGVKKMCVEGEGGVRIGRPYTKLGDDTFRSIELCDVRGG